MFRYHSAECFPDSAGKAAGDGVTYLPVLACDAAAENPTVGEVLYSRIFADGEGACLVGVVPFGLFLCGCTQKSRGGVI